MEVDQIECIPISQEDTSDLISSIARTLPSIQPRQPLPPTNYRNPQSMIRPFSRLVKIIRGTVLGGSKRGGLR